jgi:raffinose/stachyose/melibiose transport system permease protein
MERNNIRKYFPIFVLPTLLAFTAFFIVPFLMGIGLSFTKFTVITKAKFVGLDNYIKAFTSDNEFLHALGFTSLFTIVSIITVNVFSFSLALLLTRGIKGTNIFRSVFFMPNLIGGIVLGYIWNLLINGVLSKFDVDITFSAKYGFWGLVILTNWQLIGYMMVIYIAGLQNIPGDLIEAASIDGASPMTVLFKVKLPMVMPSITICTFLTLTNSFKMFDQNLALTAGAPERTTEMLALNIYNTFYGRIGWQGVGQAKAVVFFLIVALIAYIQLRLTNKKEVEQ